MLSTSSPITFPPSSSPAPPAKRVLPGQNQPPKPRMQGPFFIDDDANSEAEPDAVEPQAKKRMLSEPGQMLPARDRDAEGKLVQEEAQGEDKRTSWAPEGTSTPEIPPPLSARSDSHPPFTDPLSDNLFRAKYASRRCDGTTVTIQERRANLAAAYESILTARSRTKEGLAKRSYYGIDIHDLVDRASKELDDMRQVHNLQGAAMKNMVSSTEPPAPVPDKKRKKNLLWTEKYRARTFTDLCGDDSANRMVLRWLKRWDPLVFPTAARSKSRTGASHRASGKDIGEEDKPHRKILVLTGPPGLGKTTLAHVCARQVGYEVMEINASDERSRDVVENRIRTSLGTQNVKMVTNAKNGQAMQQPARPICLIVDEADGVTSGAGTSGEGGFVKALVDLVQTERKNTSDEAKRDMDLESSGKKLKKKKGDNFRQMRPLILICNDIYHASLRPLRRSNLAEVIHVGRPSMDAVVNRLKTVFEAEGIPCDKEAARKVCEAAWGVAGGMDAKRGAESTVEGDLRGVMVVGEWVAGRFRSLRPTHDRTLTRRWIESNIVHELASNAAGARGLGRGSVRDIVDRLFKEGGGCPMPATTHTCSKTRNEQPKAELGVREQLKKDSMERLSQMVRSSGDIGNIVTEVFAEYPGREFNDDCCLTKPNQAYEWLHFYDTCQSRLYASQEWELAPYLSQPILACHHLFASPRKNLGGWERETRRHYGAGADADGGGETPPPMAFSGPRADYEAFEAERQTRAQLQALHAQLGPRLMRSFRGVEDMATDLLPYLARILSPDIKPVVVSGSQGSMASVRKDSERAMVKRAAEVLAEVGIALHKERLEGETLPGRGPLYIYRMDPDVEVLATFDTASWPLPSARAPTRFAVRQVLEETLQRMLVLREAAAQQARLRASQPAQAAPTPTALLKPSTTEGTVKRDFFGRVVAAPLTRAEDQVGDKHHKVWVTFHEGLNNAVRRPLSLQELLHGL